LLPPQSQSSSCQASKETARMTTRDSHDGVNTAPEVTYPADKKEIGQVERVLSAEDEKVDHINYDRIDAEVAKYADATAERVHISEEENKRLKRLIDRRVLPIMIVTYFLQALDKGTMSFSSIMGIRHDIPILKQNHYVSTLASFLSETPFLTRYSSPGLPLVSILPFCVSNTPSIGPSNAFLSENFSASTFCSGQRLCAATLSASVSPHSSQSGRSSVSSKQCVSLPS